MMECEVDDPFGQDIHTRVWKLETDKGNISEELLTYQNNDGKWIGVCNRENIECSKQLYSVVIDNPSDFSIITDTYDFILLSHTKRHTDITSINPLKTSLHKRVWECKRIGS